MPNRQHDITKWQIEVLSQEAKFEVEANGFTRALRSFLIGSHLKKSLALRKAAQIQLPAKSLLRMGGSCRGVSFRCCSGLCWITQEGDFKDYLLEHEQNFTINQDGVVVVQALADTELLVSPE